MPNKPQSNIDFLILPARIARHRKISAQAKIVFAILFFWTRRGTQPAAASIRTIAKHTGLTRRQVEGAILNLEQTRAIFSLKKQGRMTKFECPTEDAIANKTPWYPTLSRERDT